MDVLDSRGRTPVRLVSGGGYRPLLVLFAVFLSGLSTGCSDAAPTAAVTAVDSAGITIFTSNGTGWGPDGAWRLELDLEVGAVGGPDAFGGIADVAPRAGGGVWVLDRQAMRVRGYDESGAEVLAFGRSGEGPGEFKSVGRLAQRPDGGLNVGGPFPPTLYRFDAFGEPLGVDAPSIASLRDASEKDAEDRGAESRMPLGPAMGSWRFAANGSAFLQVVTIEAPVDELVRRDVVLRPGSTGAPAVRFASWQSEMTSGGPGGTARLLQPSASWSPSLDGGIWFTPGGTYELRRYDADGNVRTILRRPRPRVPVTDEMEDALRAEIVEQSETSSMRAMVASAEFADSLPATMNLWVAGPEEQLWVGVVDPELGGDVRHANAWDIFASDGDYLGHLPFPAGLRPTRVTADHVYGVWLNELDVPFARRYRIIRAE